MGLRDILSLLDVVNFCTTLCSFLQFFEYACVLLSLEMQTAAKYFAYQGCAQKQKLPVSNAVTHFLTAGGCIILINCSTKSSRCYPQIQFNISATLFYKAGLTSDIICLQLCFCNLLKLISINCNDLVRSRASWNRDIICHAPVFLPSANFLKVLLTATF